MIKRLLVSSLILLSSYTAANAATLTAASPELSDVKAQVDAAAEGDTVIVPAGRRHKPLIITKGITLKGQTTIPGAGTLTASANDQI
jgi:hypothetical protein